MRHHTKFREDRSNRSGDMADFRFFKIAAAAILDFGNFKFVTVGTVKRVELRLRAKFCRNRSNRGCDMAIFHFFKMAAVRHLGLDLRVLGPPTTAVRFVFIAVDFKIRKYIPLILVRGYIQASACLYYTDCNTALY